MEFLENFKTFNERLKSYNEGLIRTIPLNAAIKSIHRNLQFSNMDYVINTDTLNNTFDFIIKDLNLVIDLEIKFHAMESIITHNCGYFPASIEIIYISGHTNKSKWYDKMFNMLCNNVDNIQQINIKYESKFDEYIDTPSIMYHITNSCYVDKILKNGLVPKSKSKLSTHPDRIYLCDVLENCEKLRFQMYMSDSYNMNGVNYKQKNNKKTSYTILKIDMRNLDIKVFKDPNYEEFGFYITKNIHKDRITVINTYVI